MSENEPKYVTHPAGEIFSSALRDGTVDCFGDDGAWLLLSIALYSWRTYFDAAMMAYTGTSPVVEDPVNLVEEQQITRDLLIQSLMYSATEQLLTFLFAAIEHRPRTTQFFETYVRQKKTVGELVSAASELRRNDIAQLIGEPKTRDEVRAIFDRVRNPVAVVDLAQVRCIDLGGLLLPETVFTSIVVDDWFEKALSVSTRAITNLDEIQALTERGDELSEERIIQPLRAIDNSFRHGLRIMFHPALPKARTFLVAEGGTPIQSPGFLVDVFMPHKSTNAVQRGTVQCNPARTTTHVETIRNLCLLLGQLVKGFLGKQVLGSCDLLLASTFMELPLE